MCPLFENVGHTAGPAVGHKATPAAHITYFSTFSKNFINGYEPKDEEDGNRYVEQRMQELQKVGIHRIEVYDIQRRCCSEA